MAGKLFNLARMTTATTGTGTLTLGSAVSGFLSFAAAGISDGDVISYAIKDGSNSEIGIGTYTSSGTTLTRTVTKSTNSNNAISLSGSAAVFITPRAEDFYMPGAPQGRLTLTTATPVVTSALSAQTTVYYTPYIGRLVPLYNGTTFYMVDIGGELSQVTTDTTKSPAACANNSAYDVFVWDNAGTMRATRGPLWSSLTARGTGAATTELEMVQGVLVNKYAITNGPSAQRGTYVGSFRTNGTASIDYNAASKYLWNTYNRVKGNIETVYSSAHTYTTASYRAWNNSTTIGQARCDFFVGLAEDAAVVLGSFQNFNTSSTDSGFVSVGVNTTTAATTPAAYVSGLNAATVIYGLGSNYLVRPILGHNYLNALQLGQTPSFTYSTAIISAELMV